MENLQSKGMFISYGEFRDDLREVRRRYEDELKSAYFIHFDSLQAKMYTDPLKDWDQVLSRFKKDVQYNIEESSKCFAMERYGAAVFHILQVAEYGVIKVAELLQIPGDKPGWGSLKGLQKLISVPWPQREPLAKKHSKLLENVVPLAFVMKDSWRHKLDHVNNQLLWLEKDFSPLVAEEIISATRAFMRKLALEFPQ